MHQAKSRRDEMAGTHLITTTNMDNKLICGYIPYKPPATIDMIGRSVEGL
jgi:hypothetical protein